MKIKLNNNCNRNLKKLLLDNQLSGSSWSCKFEVGSSQPGIASTCKRCHPCQGMVHQLLPEAKHKPRASSRCLQSLDWSKRSCNKLMFFEECKLLSSYQFGKSRLWLDQLCRLGLKIYFFKVESLKNSRYLQSYPSLQVVILMLFGTEFTKCKNANARTNNNFPIVFDVIATKNWNILKTSWNLNRKKFLSIISIEFSLIFISKFSHLRCFGWPLIT